jgi:hypothetical protein
MTLALEMRRLLWRDAAERLALEDERQPDEGEPDPPPDEDGEERPR